MLRVFTIPLCKYRMQYGAICADPPWRFDTWASQPSHIKGRSVYNHYVTMPLATIKALPVLDFAARDCALFLWTTDTHLDRSLEVITAWGFTFKTVGFYWVKTNAVAGSYFTGCGWWTRCNPEMCLLATRGRPKRLDNSVKKLIVAPRREHSRKPDEAYDAIKRLVAGPYLELFARTRRDGWDLDHSDQPDRF